MRICPACAREFEDGLAACPDDGAALVKLDTGAGERAEELVGQVVDGRYRVERIIGRGGMGTVYACRHIVVGKQFAMKVLRPGVERSEEVLQRFIREAQAANAVRSRHICEMSDFGQLEGRGGAFYVIMELLDGMSLTRALRESRLDTDRLCGVFRQVCIALDKAHARGIIHRDLKPDNVMLVHEDDDPFFVKLVDFGIAKMMRSKAGDLTETGVILGTPYYMSPEQARGDQLDARSDIYALGVMMYRAFTGKLPFVADTAMGVLTRHLTETPELPSRIADMEPALERLILRCMEKKAIDRFQSMADVAEAIDAVRARVARAASSQELRATFDEGTPSAGSGRPGPLRASPTRADSPDARSAGSDLPHPAISSMVTGSHTPSALRAPMAPRPADSVTSVRPAPATLPVADASWGTQPAEAGYPPPPEADTNHPGAPAAHWATTPDQMAAATGPHALTPSVPPGHDHVMMSSADLPMTGPHAPPPTGAANPANWLPAPNYPSAEIYQGEAPTDRGLVSTRGASLVPPGNNARRTAWIGGLTAILVLGLGVTAIALMGPTDAPPPTSTPANVPPPQLATPSADEATADDEPEEPAPEPSDSQEDDAAAAENDPHSVDVAPQTAPATAPSPKASASAPEPPQPDSAPAPSPAPEPTPAPVKKPDDGVRSPFD